MSVKTNPITLMYKQCKVRLTEPLNDQAETFRRVERICLSQMRSALYYVCCVGCLIYYNFSTVSFWRFSCSAQWSCSSCMQAWHWTFCAAAFGTSSHLFETVGICATCWRSESALSWRYLKSEGLAAALFKKWRCVMCCSALHRSNVMGHTAW